MGRLDVAMIGVMQSGWNWRPPRLSGRWAAIAAAAVMLFGAAPLAHAQEAPLPIDDYWVRMEETLSVVRAAAESGGQGRLSLLTAEADYWESIAAVALPGGDVVLVDHSYLVGELRANTPDLARLETQLTMMLAYRDRLRQFDSSEEGIPIHQSLDTILARPDFEQQTEAEQPNTSTAQRSPDSETSVSLDDIVPDVTIFGVELMRVVIIVVGGAVLLVIVGSALRRFLADMVPEAELEGGDEDELLTAETALKRAKMVSAGGDYRSAVRYLYLSSLLWLEERGLLRYDRSRTNREYVRSVSGRPDLSASLQDVVDVFDQVWYGYHDIDAETYSRYEKDVGELRRQK